MKPIELPKVHLGLLIASILLSIMLWLVVYPQTIPAERTRPLTAKVTYVGLSPDLVVTEQPETMTVFASGSMERLAAIDEDRLELVVSLSEAVPGRKRYTATITPPAYQVFFPRGEAVPFTIEEVSTKTLEVEVEPQGQLEDAALALDQFIVKPLEVVARGPKSQIDVLVSARTRYDVSKVRPGDSLSQYLAVEPVLRDGSLSELITFEPKLVEVLPIFQTAPISKPATLFAQVTGTVASGFITAGIDTSPNTVTIQGPSGLVNSINQLSTEPINIDGLTETKEYRVGIKVPKGVRVAGGLRSVKVRVIVNRDPNANPPPETEEETP